MCKGTKWTHSETECDYFFLFLTQLKKTKQNSSSSPETKPLFSPVAIRLQGAWLKNPRLFKEQSFGTKVNFSVGTGILKYFLKENRRWLGLQTSRIVKKKKKNRETGCCLLTAKGSKVHRTSVIMVEIFSVKRRQSCQTTCLLVVLFQRCYI